MGKTKWTFGQPDIFLQSILYSLIDLYEDLLCLLKIWNFGYYLSRLLFQSRIFRLWKCSRSIDFSYVGEGGSKERKFNKRGNIYSDHCIIPSQRNEEKNLSKPKANFILINIMLKKIRLHLWQNGQTNSLTCNTESTPYHRIPKPLSCFTHSRRPPQRSSHWLASLSSF